jgi:hypothetical protein
MDERERYLWIGVVDWLYGRNPASLPDGNAGVVSAVVEAGTAGLDCNHLVYNKSATGTATRRVYESNDNDIYVHIYLFDSWLYSQ